MSNSSPTTPRSSVVGEGRTSPTPASPPAPSTTPQEPKIEIEPEIHNPLSNYLEMFFTTSYFLCLSPFRIKRDKKQTGKPFKLVYWWPQRVICAIITLLSLFWIIRTIRISVPGRGKGPAGYVQLILSVITAINKLVVLVSLWFNKEAFLSIANFVHDHYTNFRWSSRRRLIVAPIVYIIMGLVLFLTIRGVDVYGGIIHDWTWNRWTHSLVYAGRYNFFLSSLPFPMLCNNTIRIVLDGEISGYMQSVDTNLVILTVLGSFTWHMLGPFCDFLMLMITLTLWTATKNYISKVKLSSKNPAGGGIEMNMKSSTTSSTPSIVVECEGDTDSMEKKTIEDCGTGSAENVVLEVEDPSLAEWKEIYEGFKYIKKLADLINGTMGTYVSTSIVENVLYYAVFFDLVFAEMDTVTDWGRRVSLLFFLASTCIIFLLCADLNQRLSALKSWLSVEENRKNVPVDMVVLLINQVDSKSVAIKASKIFPVTYQTLTAMLGVTATYFILCVKDKTLAKDMLKC